MQHVRRLLVHYPMLAHLLLLEVLLLDDMLFLLDHMLLLLGMVNHLHTIVSHAGVRLWLSDWAPNGWTTHYKQRYELLARISSL